MDFFSVRTTDYHLVYCYSFIDSWFVITKNKNITSFLTNPIPESGSFTKKCQVDIFLKPGSPCFLQQVVNQFANAKTN